jgi:hypothetical protein
MSAAAPNLSTPAAPDKSLLGQLRHLDAALVTTCNKHVRAIVLITACIEAGLQAPEKIAATLVELGFNRGHVWRMLKAGTGPSPVSHHWWSDADGQLHVYEQPAG